MERYQTSPDMMLESSSEEFPRLLIYQSPKPVMSEILLVWFSLDGLGIPKFSMVIPTFTRPTSVSFERGNHLGALY